MCLLRQKFVAKVGDVVLVPTGTKVELETDDEASLWCTGCS